ncbi:condensation domain-containing protein [Clostridium estertheticum]|nr:condensation domain-containing protein [Clostridium estertheticum]
MNLSSELIHLAVIKTKRGDHLMIAMHHLIVDGVSWRIIFKNFIEAYENICKGISYFEQNYITLQGEIDVEALKKAYCMLIKNCDIFRTVFMYENLQEPRRIVKKSENTQINFKFEDISTDNTFDEKNRIIDKYCIKGKKECFNLQAGPLMRIKLFKLDEISYRLILSDHHILMDGWSMAIVFKEIFENYESITGVKSKWTLIY